MNSATAIRRAAQQVFRTQHAPAGIPRFTPQRCLHLRQTPPPLLRKQFTQPASRIANQLRRETTLAAPRPLTDQEEPSPKDADDVAARKAKEPAYELTFTCRKCLHRSSHRVTKQAYHVGTTLITCPGCKNRHLISDHLKIFSDKSITLEDILKEKGQYLRKGRLGEDGDIEFYEEETKQA
ncbi:hypothetical protein LTR36_003718 [Oleoguttula mirabilis]|uniref:DNL-type domain-containing protein n=1 Tax=Oleoguttula mirabilis TaxID=1507867 RepID=A0AAV9JJL1_9PEZI|nr:hypothetical protein LTR36_003718 [Oleoguttula mirabilis]